MSEDDDDLFMDSFDADLVQVAGSWLVWNYLAQHSQS